MALAVVFAAGLLLAGCGSGNVAGNVSTRFASGSTRDQSIAAPTVTRTQPQPTTQTVQQTQTLERTQTVQQTVTAPPVATASPAVTVTQTSSSSGTPAWVWVLVGAAVIGAIVLIVGLVRGRKPAAPTPEERRRVVSAAVASWVAQGWAIESQTDAATILRRDGERMMLSFDAQGQMTSAPVSAPSTGESG